MQILVYVTDDNERYLGGDPLTLLIEDARARQELLFPLAKALKASVIQLKNGDHLIVREDSP